LTFRERSNDNGEIVEVARFFAVLGWFEFEDLQEKLVVEVSMLGHCFAHKRKRLSSTD
jgi:hypothetical protein